MSSTFDFIRELNRRASALEQDKLYRLQLISEPEEVSELPEVVMIDSNGTIEELGSQSDPKSDIKLPESTSDRIDGDTTAGDSSNSPTEMLKKNSSDDIVMVSNHDYEIVGPTLADLEIVASTVAPVASTPKQSRSAPIVQSEPGNDSQSAEETLATDQVSPSPSVVESFTQVVQIPIAELPDRKFIPDRQNNKSPERDEQNSPAEKKTTQTTPPKPDRKTENAIPAIVPTQPVKNTAPTNSHSQKTHDTIQRTDDSHLSQTHLNKVTLDNASKETNKPTTETTSKSETKKLTDRIIDQFPPPQSVIISFVASYNDGAQQRTAQEVAEELAQRFTENVLFIDTVTAPPSSDQMGFADLVNRGEPIERTLDTTPKENLFVMHAGQSGLTNRKTRSDILAKVSTELKKHFQYVCIAAPEPDNILTNTLCRCSDVSYLIVDIANSDQDEAKTHVDLLHRAGARLGGCIIQKPASWV